MLRGPSLDQCLARVPSAGDVASGRPFQRCKRNYLVARLAIAAQFARCQCPLAVQATDVPSSMRAADVVVDGTSSAGFRVRMITPTVSQCPRRRLVLEGLLTAGCWWLPRGQVHRLLSLLVPELARIQAFLASPADRLLLLLANLLL